jgi:putative IMPACT (imprinted ancient) family translation regulator
MLGWEREEFRSNDDGEPSGTAGKPILGQINSAKLTDVLLLVVRYFGGTLLGTGGLIKAYKEAAADAIAHAEIVEKTVDDVIEIEFDYIILNEVMRVLKQFESAQWTQDFGESCSMRVQIRRSLSPQLREMLSAIYGVEIIRIQ